jgi:hypothetical protein
MTLGSQVFTNAARYGAAEMRLITFGYYSITRGHHLGCVAPMRQMQAGWCDGAFDGQEL